MVYKYSDYELKKIASLKDVPGTIKDGDGYIWDPSELPDKDFDDSEKKRRIDIDRNNRIISDI